MLTCEQVMAEELTEKYLLNQLAEAERDAFEQHYFACDRCFGELETQRALCDELEKSAATVQAELVPTHIPFRPIWMAVLVALVLLAVAGVLLRRTPPISKPSTSVAVSPTGTAEPVRKVPAIHKPSLEELAQISPPPYSPIVLRGAPDDATRSFRSAMEHYARADYKHAIPGLRVAERLNPRAAYVSFYLGASYLLDGHVDVAIEQFRKTAKLGDSPYGEEALFYQAKGYLRKGDVNLARSELERIAKTSGTRAREASELLRQLQALSSSPR